MKKELESLSQQLQELSDTSYLLKEKQIQQIAYKFHGVVLGLRELLARSENLEFKLAQTESLEGK